MNDVAPFVALGVAWLVSMFLVRRRVIREVVARRMSIETAAVILGLAWGVLPLPALIAFPEALAPIVFVSALLFFAAAGMTVVMARIVGWR